MVVAAACFQLASADEDDLDDLNKHACRYCVLHLQYYLLVAL